MAVDREISQSDRSGRVYAELPVESQVILLADSLVPARWILPHPVVRMKGDNEQSAENSSAFDVLTQYPMESLRPPERQWQLSSAQRGDRPLSLKGFHTCARAGATA